jgi:hypothetical protein
MSDLNDKWWELPKAMKYANLMFAYHSAESAFEDALLEAAGDEPAQDAFVYGRIGGDYYDESIELYDVGNDVRLNDAQQRLLHESGFTRVWLNHKDGMETYYYWGRDEFSPVEAHRNLGHKARSALTPRAEPTSAE